MPDYGDFSDVAAALRAALANYARISVLVTVAVANPSQANIDAVVNGAQQAGLVVPRPTQSLDGESYDWNGYQRQITQIMAELKQQLVFALGPFEERSQAR